MGTVLRLADTAASDAPARSETHCLGMAEMGYRGVSENWLLKRLGDLHWQLIADAMGQAQAIFATAEGRPVYAAFCAISLTLDGPARPELGTVFGAEATLYQVSPTRLASLHDLRIGSRPLGRVVMVTTFVSHAEPGRNRSVLRSAPVGAAALRALPLLPPGARDLVDQSADLARGRRSRHLGLGARCAGDAPLARFRPCPATDFNAAGLLYFPSFVALADQAEWAAFPDAAGALQTQRRDVIYLGNIDPGEAVVAHLTDLRRGPGGFDHAITLSREDGRPLAKVFSQRLAKPSGGSPSAGSLESPRREDHRGISRTGSKALTRQSR